MPTSVFAHPALSDPAAKRRQILNITIDNFTKEELIDRLDRFGGVVFTPNSDHLIKLQVDRAFYQAYQAADYRVCDGKIVWYIMYLMGRGVKEKISGSDFFPYFYQYHRHNKEIKIFLLGAAEGVAYQAQRNINAKVGRQIVVQTHSPSFGFEHDEAECWKIIDLINASGATVLAIGVGSPKQEIWIYRYRKYLKNIKIFLAIGATIDFEAGHKRRAPKWMSNLGLETIYRIAQEPGRLWRRYLIEDPPVFYLALLQMLNLYKDPFRDI